MSESIALPGGWSTKIWRTHVLPLGRSSGGIARSYLNFISGGCEPAEAVNRRKPSVRSCVCSAAASDLTKPTRYGYRQQTHSNSRSRFQATGQHRGRGELDRHPSVGSLPPWAPPVPEVFRHQLDALERAAELDAPLWLKSRPRSHARCMASCSLQSP